MELVVLSSQGIPDDSILSIRAGSVRKQAPLSACDKPFKFPCKVEECDAVKVEVLSVMGFARALCVGGPQTHQLNLEAVRSAIMPPVDGEAAISIRLQAEGEGDRGDGSVRVSPERRKAKILTETDKYMDKHSVLAALQGALKNLMRDRPDDPMAFLAKHFSQKQVGGAPPAVTGSQAGAAPASSSGAWPPVGAPAAADVTERMQTLEAENMALRHQLASVARLASAASGEVSVASAPADATAQAVQAWAPQAAPAASSVSIGEMAVASPPQVVAPAVEVKAELVEAEANAEERGRATSPTTDEQRRIQLKLRHEAELVQAAALERAQLMAEMGRIEALMEAARSQQGVRKSQRSRGTSPDTSSDVPSTRLPATPAMSQR